MRGPRDRVRSTTRLPAALREELGIEHARGPRRVNSITARKQARREKRNKSQPQPKRRRIVTEPATEKARHEPQKPVSAPRVPPIPPKQPTENPKKKKSKDEPQMRTITDPITGEKRRVEQKQGNATLAALTAEPEAPAPVPKRKLTQAERVEEDEIAWLEYQLYGRRGKRTNEGDDLDCA